MEEKNIKSCKECKFAECSRITSGLKDNYSNWFCKRDGKKMVINMSVRDSNPLYVPIWCPLKKSNSSGVIVNTTSERVNEDKEFSNKPKRKYMTSLEKKAILEKFEPKVQWDDIKVNTVYHVPPLLFDGRKDIMIISKTNYSCTYRVLSKDPKNSTGVISTMYKTTLMSRFIVPHKIQTIEVVTSKQ